MNTTQLAAGAGKMGETKTLTRKSLLRRSGLIAALSGLACTAAGGYGHWTALRDLGLMMVCVGAIWLLFSHFASNEPMRPAQRRYVREFFPAMIAYVVVVFSVWPMADHVHATWLKVLIALAPILPVALVVRAVVRKILASDELERRVQLEAISIASLSVGMLSFAAGFLASAGVLPFDSSTMLILVLPLLFVVYGVALGWIRRRYYGQ